MLLRKIAAASLSLLFVLAAASCSCSKTCPEGQSCQPSASVQIAGGGGETPIALTSQKTCQVADDCRGSSTGIACTVFNGCDANVHKCKLRLAPEKTCMAGEAVPCEPATAGERGIYVCPSNCLWPSDSCKVCGKSGTACCMGPQSCNTGACTADPAFPTTGKCP